MFDVTDGSSTASISVDPTETRALTEASATASVSVDPTETRALTEASATSGTTSAVVVSFGLDAISHSSTKGTSPIAGIEKFLISRSIASMVESIMLSMFWCHLSMTLSNSENRSGTKVRSGAASPTAGSD
eukprot:Protomagalhaensia_wolfi_Nauph_80__2334@NODE_2530_length_1065_cov_145_480507_g514_i2_p2_GENE_NODE_2530_length_1065_cov_145_480507_g514_i2NODE_2530_length_1065_cov_145_480507_g514_i2_p2_ORF_typecomplete_len131_score10_49Condensation/PF00668_20/0_1_NODE_2530_length_1065_cov_145_480507_g514_i2512904